MINMSFNSDCDALSNEGLFVEIFQLVPKLEGGFCLADFRNVSAYRH